jgi:hypothetical protein
MIISGDATGHLSGDRAGGAAAPDIAAPSPLPLCSCGYWWQSNCLWAGQRPGGGLLRWRISGVMQVLL